MEQPQVLHTHRLNHTLRLRLLVNIDILSVLVNILNLVTMEEPEEEAVRFSRTLNLLELHHCLQV